MLNWSTFLEVSQGLISIVLLIAFTLTPFLFMSVLFENYEHLNKKLMRDKIGSMYPGVWLDEDDTHNFGISLTIIFLFR